MTELDPLLEQVLRQVGDNGKYQKCLFWFFLIPFYFIVPFTVFVQIFQSALPDHWCHVPGKPENISLEQWKNITIPLKDASEIIYSNCKQFQNHPFSWHEVNEKNDTEIDCQNGWDFDNTLYDRTLPTDNNWVCNKREYATSWMSVGLFGKFTGTILFSCLSDRLGRKLVTVSTSLLYAVFSIGRLFVTSTWALSILLFISSMAFPAIFEMPMILVMEQVPQEMRVRISTASFIMWGMGMVSLPFLAWLTRDWITLGMATSLPFFPFLAIWWLACEPPRWLISQGHKKECLEALEYIARVNGKECPPDLEKSLQIIMDSNKTENTTSFFSFIQLLKYPVLRKRLLILSCVYACNEIIFFAISYNTSYLGGNEFLNFFYVSITQLPGVFIAEFCAKKLGRRATQFGFMFLTAVTSGIASIVAAFDLELVVYILAINRPMNTITYVVIYIQMAELLPTTHRGSGIGYMSIASGMVGICVPYLTYSGVIWHPLPYLILTIIVGFGAVLSFFLPETKGTNLPQTIADAEEHLTDQSLWSYTGWRPCQKREEELLITSEDKSYGIRN